MRRYRFHQRPLGYDVRCRQRNSRWVRERIAGLFQGYVGLLRLRMEKPATRVSRETLPGIESGIQALALYEISAFFIDWSRPPAAARTQLLPGPSNQASDDESPGPHEPEAARRTPYRCTGLYARSRAPSPLGGRLWPQAPGGASGTWRTFAFMRRMSRGSASSADGLPPPVCLCVAPPCPHGGGPCSVRRNGQGASCPLQVPVPMPWPDTEPASDRH